MTDPEILRAAAATLRVDARRAGRGDEISRSVAAFTGAAPLPPTAGAHVARWLVEAAELCESVADMADAMERIDALLALRGAGGNLLQRATWVWVQHTIWASTDGPVPDD